MKIYLVKTYARKLKKISTFFYMIIFHRFAIYSYHKRSKQKFVKL